MTKCINILIKSSLNFNTVFIKDFAYLLYMVENWQESLDEVGYYGALLTYLSKVFDCIMHDLLIAKLQAYGFDHNSLNFISNYLLDRKQIIKVNSFFSTWSKI